MVGASLEEFSARCILVKGEYTDLKKTIYKGALYTLNHINHRFHGYYAKPEVIAT